MNNNRLKILAVSSEVPWPLNSGGHLRSFHLLRELSRSTSLRLVVPTQQTKDENAQELLQHGIDVIEVPGCSRKKLSEGWKVFQSILRREPYVFYRRHFWKQVESEIRKQIELDRPDLVYFDHLDSATYREAIGNVPHVVDMHNVYSSISQRLSEEEPNILKQIYLRHETRLLEKIEEQMAKAANSVFAVSEIERDHFQRLGAKSVRTIPNGVDCEHYKNRNGAAERNEQNNEILFVGDLSWAPNISAALFLARKVISEVRSKVETAKLTIVGRNPVPEVLQLDSLEGVTVVSNAPEILTYYHRASVLAVPLQSGGGTRLKILEAFATGLPVVSTPVGCEGLEVVHNKHLFVSECADISEEILQLLSSPETQQKVSVAGLELAEETYDWKSIGANLVSSVQSFSSLK